MRLIIRKGTSSPPGFNYRYLSPPTTHLEHAFFHAKHLVRVRLHPGFGLVN